MTQPTDLNKFKKARHKARAKANTLCRSGFHKWQFDARKQFDVKRGKLISTQSCTRCGATREHAH